MDDDFKHFSLFPLISLLILSFFFSANDFSSYFIEKVEENFCRIPQSYLVMYQHLHLHILTVNTVLYVYFCLKAVPSFIHYIISTLAYSRTFLQLFSPLLNFSSLTDLFPSALPTRYFSRVRKIFSWSYFPLHLPPNFASLSCSKPFKGCL